MGRSNFQGIAPFGVFQPYNFYDKNTLINQHIRYVLNRTAQMFHYEGLPETCPARSVELFEQVNGYIGIAKVKGNLYPFWGGLGGEPDPVYMPTLFTVANPALDYSANLKIGSECIVIPNDKMYMGLLPLLREYCTLIAENECSIRLADINSRIIAIVTSADSVTKEAATRYYKDVEDGKLGVVSTNAFLDSLKTQPYGTTATAGVLKELIEERQYLISRMYNDLGLQSNFNMKRESLNSAETGLNEDILLPLIDDMLECRQEGWEAVNALFGTEVTVELGSAWQRARDVMDAEQEALETAAEGPEEPEGEEPKDKEDDPEPEKKEVKENAENE